MHMGSFDGQKRSSCNLLKSFGLCLGAALVVRTRFAQLTLGC
jgi:hypothetical protein